MSGGLFDPLGTDRPEPTWRAPRLSAPALAAALIAAALAALVALAWLRDDGDRGRPVAVVPIERVDAPPKPSAPPAAPAPALPAASPPAPAALPPPREDQEVEIQNGVRIVRPRRDAAPKGGQTLAVPPPPAGR